MWQCFRHDVALVVSGLPYADGRYQPRGLPAGASADVAGYLAWRPHPSTGEDAPVGFAVAKGLTGERWSVAALWVAPVVRRDGVGRQLALDVIQRHRGPWTVAFQRDNGPAAAFWRGIADESIGPDRWREDERAVPGRPDADHWIESL